uniref:Chromosome 9 open reading frame 57 n=1 Tax=Homo sapiens TaxID=9606 RepID=A0A494C1R2_HUMAN
MRRIVFAGVILFRLLGVILFRLLGVILFGRLGEHAIFQSPSMDVF